MVTGFLHCSGQQILDSNNNQVKLFGINWGQFDGLIYGIWGQSTCISQADVQAIAANGGNFLRINLFPWSMVEPTDEGYNTNTISYLDNIAAWCYAAGVYLTINFTGLNMQWSTGAAALYTTSESLPNVPTWVLPNGQPGSDAEENAIETGFYDLDDTDYDAMRASYVTMWTYILNHTNAVNGIKYKDNPFFIIDFWNEPNSEGAGDAHYMECESWLIAQMRTAGYLNPVIVSIQNVTTPYNLTGDTNVIFDYHIYMVYDTTQDPAHMWTESQWEASIGGRYTQYIDAYDRPLIIGEWAVDWSIDGADQGINNGMGTTILETWSAAASTFLQNTSYISGSLWFQGSSFYNKFGCTSWGSCYSSAETTWILANLMDGGTGPVDFEGGGGTTYIYGRGTASAGAGSVDVLLEEVG